MIKSNKVPSTAQIEFICLSKVGCNDKTIVLNAYSEGTSFIKFKNIVTSDEYEIPLFYI